MVTCRPIEACLVLLPVFEFLHSNKTFLDVLSEPMLTHTDNKPHTSSSPLPYHLITLSSYLTTHATSLSSPRAIAYANLALSILLTFVEKEEIMRPFSQPSLTDIRLCRQVSDHTGLFLTCTLNLWREETACASTDVSASSACMRYIGLLCSMASSQPTQTVGGIYVHVGPY